jgi:OOP family OmpA-OmpF porin
MKILSATHRTLILATALGLATLTVSANAGLGYLMDWDIGMERSGTALCWHTGEWTPELATLECDPVQFRAAAGKFPTSAAVGAAPTPVDQTPIIQAYISPVPVEPVALAYVAPLPIETIRLSADTLFEFDKSVIKPAGKTQLDELLRKMQSVDYAVIMLIGHTDSVGTDAYNMKLSLRRADVVKAYLVSQGVDANRINTKGEGKRNPVASNSTEEGRARDRHVEVELAGTVR